MLCLKYFCIALIQNGDLKREQTSIQKNGCRRYDFRVIKNRYKFGFSGTRALKEDAVGQFSQTKIALVSTELVCDGLTNGYFVCETFEITLYFKALFLFKPNLQNQSIDSAAILLHSDPSIHVLGYRFGLKHCKQKLRHRLFCFSMKFKIRCHGIEIILQFSTSPQ